MNWWPMYGEKRFFTVNSSGGLQGKLIQKSGSCTTLFFSSKHFSTWVNFTVCVSKNIGRVLNNLHHNHCCRVLDVRIGFSIATVFNFQHFSASAFNTHLLQMASYIIDGSISSFILMLQHHNKPKISFRFFIVFVNR